MRFPVTVEFYDQRAKVYAPASNFPFYRVAFKVAGKRRMLIPPIQKPTKAANWQDALGAEPPEIRQRFLARLAHKPKGTHRRYRRMVEAAAAKLPESFSWANILPADNPPPPVHCELNRRQLEKSPLNKRR